MENIEIEAEDVNAAVKAIKIEKPSGTNGITGNSLSMEVKS